MVAAQLALGRVLSPQFVLWLVPLVPLVAGRRGRAATALLALALVATQVWFPDLYRDYVNERGVPRRLSAHAKRAAAAPCCVVLAVPTPRRLRSPSSPTAANSMKAGATGTA